MPNMKSLVRELARYALARKGTEQDSSWRSFDTLEYPHMHVPGATWTEFFELDSPDPFGRGPRDPQMALSGYEWFVRVYVKADRLKEHKERHPVILETQWVERDGHVQMAVPLDAGLPVEFLKSLIDEAYEIVWNKLGPDARLKIELAGLPYDEPKLMDRLSEIHSLKQHRKAIHKIVRHAILLRTKKSSEAKIPLGAAKIGGRPDLSPDAEWPAFSDGKPLAFLAQIDLAAIAKMGTPIQGLPHDGLLSVFSAWGWTEKDDADPHPPREGWQEQVGWTAVLHTPTQAKLERRRTPRGVNSFPAAAVEPAPILSLPNYREEPPLAALKWTDDEFKRFDGMQSDYRSLQMGHWLKSSNSFTSHHLLGGYALFQQEYPSELAGTGRAMFLQIGSDGNSRMCWGDDGELTFYADAKALAKGRFERIWGTCQCG